VLLHRGKDLVHPTGLKAFQRCLEFYVNTIERNLEDSPLVFVPKEEVEKFEFDIEHAGYNPGVIDVLGNKVGVILKQELRTSLMDPSSDDLETLTAAGNYYSNFATNKYGDKAKIPAETSFGRFIEDSKIHSLIGNIYKFPTNEINKEKMEKYGLFNEEILSLANEAYKTYCQTSGSLDLGGGMNSLDSVGGSPSKSKRYSGNSDSVDVSSDVCEVGSHYKLNTKIETVQKEVQKKMPVLNEEYSFFENKATQLMRKNYPELTEQTATNVFRMFLNLGGVYDNDKALPIK